MQTVKEDLQCTSKYGQLRISLDICHVRMTAIEDFLTMYGHSDNLLNNNVAYQIPKGGGVGVPSTPSPPLYHDGGVTLLVHPAVAVVSCKNR